MSFRGGCKDFGKINVNTKWLIENRRAGTCYMRRCSMLASKWSERTGEVLPALIKYKMLFYHCVHFRNRRWLWKGNKNFQILSYFTCMMTMFSSYSVGLYSYWVLHFVSFYVVQNHPQSPSNWKIHARICRLTVDLGCFVSSWVCCVKTTTELVNTCVVIVALSLHYIV